MNHVASFLLKMEPFSKLPVAEVERLSLLSQLVRHAKGETIYTEGVEAESVWVLQEGRAVLFKYNSDGRPLAIDAVQQGELLSTSDHLGDEGTTYACTAVACVKTISIRIPQRFYHSLYTRCPVMISSVLELVSRQLARMRDRTMTYQEPVRQRVVRTLFQLKQASGNTLPYTKREISELAATTVETTIRILSDFQKKRWVTSERGKITLKDVPHLRALINESEKAHGAGTMRAMTMA